MQNCARCDDASDAATSFVSSVRDSLANVFAGGDSFTDEAPRGDPPAAGASGAESARVPPSLQAEAPLKPNQFEVRRWRPDGRGRSNPPPLCLASDVWCLTDAGIPRQRCPRAHAHAHARHVHTQMLHVRVSGRLLAASVRAPVGAVPGT